MGHLPILRAPDFHDTRHVNCAGLAGRVQHPVINAMLRVPERGSFHGISEAMIPVNSTDSELVVLPGAATSRELLEAASRLLGWGGGATPILLGRREDFMTTGEILGLDLRRARFLFPVDDPVTEDLVRWLGGRAPFSGHTGDQVRAMLLLDEFLYGAALVGSGRGTRLVLWEGANAGHREAHGDLEGLVDPVRIIGISSAECPFDAVIRRLENR